jgi:MFS family permease
MFAARFFVGVGEAAYGSVGIAVIIAVFPPHLRSTLSGAFLAGGAFGSVLGMALGGVIAAQFGWRWAFGAMAIFGIALVILYALIVTEKRLNPDGPATAANRPGKSTNVAGFRSFRGLLSGLFSSVSVCCAYAGSGLQLFMMGAMMAWLPSFVNRYYELPPDRAGMVAAVFVLVGAIGMTLCGVITDKLSRNFATRKWSIAITYSVLASSCLMIGFHLPTGPAQLVVLAVGMFFIAGTTGPVGAMVANLTHPAIHATAFATWSLANNLIGMAPGPFLTGALADRVGLIGALQWMPMAGLAAAAVFALGRRTYSNDLKRIQTLQAEETN